MSFLTNDFDKISQHEDKELDPRFVESLNKDRQLLHDYPEVVVGASEETYDLGRAYGERPDSAGVSRDEEASYINFSDVDTYVPKKKAEVGTVVADFEVPKDEDDTEPVSDDGDDVAVIDDAPVLSESDEVESDDAEPLDASEDDTASAMSEDDAESVMTNDGTLYIKHEDEE